MTRRRVKNGKQQTQAEPYRPMERDVVERIYYL